MVLVHTRISCFALLVLVSLVRDTLYSATAERITTDYILYSKKIVVKKGKRSDHNPLVLHTNELTGTQDKWSTYIELTPNKKKHDSRFQFTIPSSTSSSTPNFDGNKMTAFTFQVNIKGPKKERQKWQFRIRNYKTKKWDLLTGNKKGDSNSWVWYILEKSMTFSEEEGTFLDQYTDSKNKKAWIRLTSNNKKDVLNLDYMALSLTTINSSGDGLLAVGDTWTYDIGGYFGEPYTTKVVMIDLFETSNAIIAKLKNQGKTVCCYFSAGTWEEWRDDADDFPNSILGKDMEDWDDERWIDIRHEETMAIMKGRMQVASDKGCHALEPDNVDGYANDSGFDLTKNDQITFLKDLSKAAKDLGLLIGLKNSDGLVNDLEPFFDFSIVESCYKYNECCRYDPFVRNGKPVFAIEYNGGKKNNNLCDKFKSKDFSLILGNYAVSKLSFCDSRRYLETSNENERSTISASNFLNYRPSSLVADDNLEAGRSLGNWGSC